MGSFTFPAERAWTFRLRDLLDFGYRFSNTSYQLLFTLVAAWTLFGCAFGVFSSLRFVTYADEVSAMLQDWGISLWPRLDLRKDQGPGWWQSALNMRNLIRIRRQIVCPQLSLPPSASWIVRAFGMGLDIWSRIESSSSVDPVLWSQNEFLREYVERE